MIELLLALLVLFLLIYGGIKAVLWVSKGKLTYWWNRLKDWLRGYYSWQLRR